ncbi:hypothetical protein [Coraliomargarita akajimensis]|uniref:Uncharacterized protein n=1 Tax=Coraliomargarita akajimensis (strain DSM 45221 / IAM 15411 / JCM 23193 / KCTC 12865 / 04OKA010-24) TaxID=583355 RepID=D5EPL6_CORAD|nr:hypothetical protein [Coraliomargarita akajimensis]ADE53753.1 hypothetical protein Caka_0729 [Coraliomargarita akajimensis DSM 45221]
MLRYFYHIANWLILWLYYICLICATGAVLGTLSHVVWAMCFVEQADYSYYAALGFLHGFQYAGVWAGGASIVICVMRARKEWLLKQGESKSSKE